MSATIQLELKDSDLQQLVGLAAEMAHEKVLSDLRIIVGAHSTPKISVPKIGEVWPGQGGFNGGLMRGIDGGRDYYIIVADEEYEFKSTFGSYGTSIETSDWDGAANTKLMAESPLDFPAAKKCASLVIDGHNDYFLLARRESRMAASVVPEKFNQENYYGTSTQFSATTAYVQVFSDGFQTSSGKLGERRFRPVRRLFI
jgi:hypothetical protein